MVEPQPCPRKLRALVKVSSRLNSQFLYCLGKLAVQIAGFSYEASLKVHAEKLAQTTDDKDRQLMS